MAKRKSSAALFEVIHADKRFKPSSRPLSFPSLPSPIAWLRKRAAASASKAERAPSAKASRSTEPSRIWKFLASIPKVAMSTDSDRHVVSFRLSYTTALVGTFAVVAVIAVAFVVGKQMHRHVGPALADMTTDELRTGPAQPEVLDLNNNESAPMAMATAPVPSGTTVVTPTSPAKPATPQTARPSWSEPKAPPTTSELNGHRTVNQQYVLIQSYPAAEKKLAEDACQLLCSRGVLCTVEYDTYYAPGWYVVVGVSGFDRTRGVPEYDAYVARIQKVSDEFAGKSKFKRFEPKPFRWREPKSAVN